MSKKYLKLKCPNKALDSVLLKPAPSALFPIPVNYVPSSQVREGGGGEGGEEKEEEGEGERKKEQKKEASSILLLVLHASNAPASPMNTSLEIAPEPSDFLPAALLPSGLGHHLLFSDHYRSLLAGLPAHCCLFSTLLTKQSFLTPSNQVTTLLRTTQGSPISVGLTQRKTQGCNLQG